MILWRHLRLVMIDMTMTLTAFKLGMRDEVRKTSMKLHDCEAIEIEI